MSRHVLISTKSSCRRRPLLRARTALHAARLPVALARVDLSQPGELQAHQLISRFSTGRWPRWRLLGICRQGQSLYVAVEWLRSRASRPFSVVEVSLESVALSWKEFASARQARLALSQVAIRRVFTLGACATP
ncbi:MAG: hypothetical protein JNJ46_12590 [Myxococcales bacterium]|nr:hypothetical protein [Myxococcales bacterium]